MDGLDQILAAISIPPFVTPVAHATLYSHLLYQLSYWGIPMVR